MTNTKTYTVTDSGQVLVHDVDKSTAIATWAKRRSLYRAEHADNVVISVVVDFRPRGRELRAACEDFDGRLYAVDPDEAQDAANAIAAIETEMDARAAAKAAANAPDPDSTGDAVPNTTSPVTVVPTVDGLAVATAATIADPQGSATSPRW